MLNITEILSGSGSTITSSILSLVNPSVRISIARCSALLTSIAIFITSESIIKLKIRFNKLRDLINVNTLLFEGTLKESMIDKKR